LLEFIWLRAKGCVKLRYPCAISFALGLALLASPAFGSIVACASGNLSAVDGTTCDIGNLQFTFTGLQSANTGGIAWTDSDFFFTALPNGFDFLALQRKP
jgi:hypothetical protein